MTFYKIPQSNSGGYYIENIYVGVTTIIEAETKEEAIEKAEAIGIEFGMGSSSCRCCGPRWSTWDIEEVEYPFFATRYTKVIYYADGRSKRIGEPRGY